MPPLTVWTLNGDLVCPSTPPARLSSSSATLALTGDVASSASDNLAATRSAWSVWSSTSDLRLTVMTSLRGKVKLAT
jgi:hypothetical protein